MDLVSTVEDTADRMGTTATLARRLTDLAWSDVTPQAATVGKHRRPRGAAGPDPPGRVRRGR